MEVKMEYLRGPGQEDKTDIEFLSTGELKLPDAKDW